MKQEIYKLMENFSRNIKIERLSHKMTQKQVADSLKIKTQSYQAYEKNVSMPTLENLLKLAILFDVSLNDLFEI